MVQGTLLGYSTPITGSSLRQSAVATSNALQPLQSALCQRKDAILMS